MEIVITKKEGPIAIESTGGKEINNNYDLWDSIVANEHFPATLNTGFYLLSLKKDTTVADDVRRIEQELIDLLRELCYVWPFASGSLMNIESERIQKIIAFESNANEVEQLLLKNEGKSRLTHTVNLACSVSASYRRLPLKMAIDLVQAAKTDEALHALFEYYYRACTDTRTWFIHLYKILDVFKEVYGKKLKRAKSILQIPHIDSEKEEIEGVLNNFDLRRAKRIRQKRQADLLTEDKVNRVMQVIRQWIQAYLHHKKLVT